MSNVSGHSMDADSGDEDKTDDVTSADGLIDAQIIRCAGLKLKS